MRTSIGADGVRAAGGDEGDRAGADDERTSIGEEGERAGTGDEVRASSGDDGARARGRSLPRAGDEPGRGGSDEGICPVGRGRGGSATRRSTSGVIRGRAPGPGGLDSGTGGALAGVIGGRGVGKRATGVSGGVADM
jgi:hypothetical protein